jgi:phosphatidylglycerophosphate synthase
MKIKDRILIVTALIVFLVGEKAPLILLAAIMTPLTLVFLLDWYGRYKGWDKPSDTPIADQVARELRFKA